MKLEDKLERFFNWASQPSKRSYTLGEFYQHRVKKKSYAEISSTAPRFKNLGRAWERAHTVTGAMTAAVVLGTVPFSVIPLSAGLGYAAAALVVGKIGGFLGGKIVDSALFDSHTPYKNAPPEP